MKPRFINLFRKTGRLSFDTAGETPMAAQSDDSTETKPELSDSKGTAHPSDAVADNPESPANETVKAGKRSFFENSCPVILSGVNPGFWTE